MKLVAYALIRAGYDVVGIQPQPNRSVKTKVIQVGHNPRLAAQPPFTAEMIAASPLPALRRAEQTPPAPTNTFNPARIRPRPRTTE